MLKRSIVVLLVGLGLVFVPYWLAVRVDGFENTVLNTWAKGIGFILIFGGSLLLLVTLVGIAIKYIKYGK